MNITEVLAAFQRAGRRTHLVGSLERGVVIALDLEGRIYTVLGGKVINRVNPEAIAEYNLTTPYLNPGGDGLWPAPEGTRFGYQYASGVWCVQPGIQSARYRPIEVGPYAATIAAEINLVNNLGIGIPVLFKRCISLDDQPGKLNVTVIESITYLGTRVLSASEFLLAPWTLCQFDCGPGCHVVFPGSDKTAMWDLYEETISDKCRWHDGNCIVPTEGSARFQIGLGPEIPWIEFRDSSRKLVIRRQASMPPEGQSYIDIRDADPATDPDPRGVRYSVYGDPSGFMEIEAVGGCPKELIPNQELSVSVTTSYLYQQANTSSETWNN